MAIDGFEPSAKERLSALADGELDPAGSSTSCEAWARDAALRADWHAWHLIASGGNATQGKMRVSGKCGSEMHFPLTRIFPALTP